MEQTQVPVMKGFTNKDLAEWALALMRALNEANADKLAVRRWMDGLAE